MIAIFKREFKAYMHTVVGFLFMAVMVFFFGLYAAVYHLVSGSTMVAQTMNAIIFIFFIAIPVLTMRILADERKQKTDQLILTAPITTGKIVLGKFFAMAAIFLIPVVGMCFLPIFLQRFGTVSLTESYVAILAFVLYGLTCIAVGLFVSSITESQVIAAVLTFGILFLTYMMSGIESLISTTGNLFTKFLGIFDFQTRFINTVNGMLDVTSVVYFVSVTILCLFLTTQSIQKRRYSVSVKNLSMGAYSTGSIVFMIAITVIVNMAVAKLPTKYTSIDITDNKLYTITKQTTDMLEKLQEDVTIYVIASEKDADGTLAQTLKCYEEASQHVKVEYVDPLVNPKFAAKYTTSGISQNSVIVETDKRYQVINYNDLYETEIDYSTYQSKVTGYDGEGKITSAIAYCTSDDMPKMYLISGHNEYALDSGFTTAIEKENITYETISLMEYEAIPKDAKCVMIHAPEKDFSKDDAQKIIDYINNGGKVMITTELVASDLPNFESILQAFGMSLQKGYAVDTSAKHYYQTPIYLLPNVEYATETSGLTDEHTYLLAPYAMGVAVPEDSDEITYTKLLSGSDDSHVKVNVEAATSFAFEEGDIEGPVCLGVKAEKTVENGVGTLYVFTSAQMFTDNVDQAVAGNNKILFSNIMSQVADHETSVSIPVKSYDAGTLTTSSKDAYLFMTIVTALIPLCFLGTGLGIWIKRRKQ